MMVAGRRSLKKPVAGRTSQEKPVCSLLPASHVGEQTGGEKLAALLSPCQPLVKLLSQGGRPHTLKIGVGIPNINHKVKPHTGYQINLRSGAAGQKIFTSMERIFLKS
jgi:hypothetical protein